MKKEKIAAPMRIVRSRQYKQVSPNGLPIVYVGRPTKWGNPHKVGVSLAKEPELSNYDYRYMTEDDAVQAYLETILYWINKAPEKYNLSELKGKNLSCWCAKTCKCHADVLLELANENTVGQLITAAIERNELNPDVVEKVLKFPTGTIKRLMNDDYYTNSIPIILFKNLVLSLHIPFEKIETAILPTFKLLVSKETKQTLAEKPPNYMLWECEEAVIKYTQRLMELYREANGKA